MKFDKIHNKGQARLFQNDYLEMLTKTHPLVIWTMYMPVFIGLPIYSYKTLGFSGQQIFIWYIVGMFSWTFAEYILHRFVFHMVSDNPNLQKFAYIMHGNHHHYPRDRQRLFMPPVPSIILASLLFLFFYSFLRQNTFMFFPGFLLGYLLYGTCHYPIHAWNPPFKFMKPLWRNHHLHHYKDEHKGFGVSTTFWDRVFGTMFDLSKEKKEQEKVKELMFEKNK